MRLLMRAHGLYGTKRQELHHALSRAEVAEAAVDRERGRADAAEARAAITLQSLGQLLESKIVRAASGGGNRRRGDEDDSSGGGGNGRQGGGRGGGGGGGGRRRGLDSVLAAVPRYGAAS